MTKSPDIKRFFSVHALLWLAMALALLGSLRHVAATFASIDGNIWWGWGQALAVDAGLVALALAISQRRRAKRDTTVLWVGVGVFSAVSVYANLSYGLTHIVEIPPIALASLPLLADIPGYIVAAKPYIMAAPLPLLALYLAEIVGSDVSHAIKEAERAENKDKSMEIKELKRQLSDAQEAIESLRASTAGRDMTLTDRLRQWLDNHDGGSGWTQEQIAQEIGCARSLVGQVLAERKGLRIAK